jgi:hypothetical protein
LDGGNGIGHGVSFWLSLDESVPHAGSRMQSDVVGQMSVRSVWACFTGQD